MIEEIIYKLYVVDQVEKGRAEIKDGKFITVDDLEKEIEAW